MFRTRKAVYRVRYLLVFLVFFGFTNLAYARTEPVIIRCVQTETVKADFTKKEVLNDIFFILQKNDNDSKYLSAQVISNKPLSSKLINVKFEDLDYKIVIYAEDTVFSNEAGIYVIDKFTNLYKRYSRGTGEQKGELIWLSGGPCGKVIKNL